MKAKTLFVILVLATLLLAHGAAAQPEEPIHAVDQPVTIRLTTWRHEDVEMWQHIIAEFDKLETNITVEYAPILNREYDSVLKTNLQAGTADEIIFVRSWDAGRVIYDAGYLEPITEEMVPNINDFADTLLASWQTEDGTIYGVPANWVGFGIYYNKDMFDQYGLTPPATIDEFFQVCATLNDNGVIPVAGGSKDPWTLEHMVSDQFLPVFYGGEEGHQKFLAGEILPTSEPFIEHLDFMLRLRDECWPPGFEGVAYGDTQQMFVAGLAAMFLGGSWEIAVFEGLNPDLNYGYFPTPVLSAGDTSWLAVTPAGAYGLNTANTPEEREAALVFINWLASPEGGKIQGDELVGQFPAMPNTPLPDHPIAKDWVAQQGENGENLTIWWTFQTINAQEPGSQPLAWEALQAMMNGEMTPDEAALHIQEGVASWYEPWQQATE